MWQNISLSFRHNPAEFCILTSDNCMHIRRPYILAALLVIAAGVLSRLRRTGIALLDKYAGDALYAVLLYLLLRAAWPRWRAQHTALISLILMAGIETFQLTGIPAAMARSGKLLLKIAAIVLGTGFSWRDMLAYAVGIGAVWLLEVTLARRRAGRKEE